jgi:uncharacterized protein (DUF1810 family)
MKFELERFYIAQNSNNFHYSYSITNYESAIKELELGKKDSHWIWYIFPQIKGLGQSNDSTYYGLSGLEEARAYLEDHILAERLYNCFKLTLEMNADLFSVFHNDEKKVRACATLFSKANDHHSDLFDRVIEKHFNNQYHDKTLELLGL